MEAELQREEEPDWFYISLDIVMPKNRHPALEERLKLTWLNIWAPGVNGKVLDASRAPKS